MYHYTHSWDNLHHWISLLTHWGRVTHICFSKIISIGLDNPGILLIEPLGTKFYEFCIKMQYFSFKKVHLRKQNQNITHPWLCSRLCNDRICETCFVYAFCVIVAWLKSIWPSVNTFDWLYHVTHIEIRYWYPIILDLLNNCRRCSASDDKLIVIHKVCISSISFCRHLCRAKLWYWTTTVWWPDSF